MIFMLIATADIPIPLAGGIQRVKNFALIGAGGYIAPRHLKAIHDTGNRLIAAADPNDSVGVLDQYFPHTRFFTEIERFDRFVEKLRREKSPDTVNYVSVCSPNYLHDAHVRLGLRIHADVICEKPLVLSPWNIDALAQLEQEFGRRIYTVLQLRLLPSLIALKHTLESETSRKRASVDLRYITPRGPWYEVSWKGNDRQSGGVVMNIGIHFFDLLLWLFGAAEKATVTLRSPQKMSGTLELAHADVSWFLSTDAKDLPAQQAASKTSAFRQITIDGEPIEFSSGFTDLHTAVYQDVLSGGGFGVETVRASIELAHDIRHMKLTPGSSPSVTA